jgi:hypothetical protein
MEESQTQVGPASLVLVRPFADGFKDTGAWLHHMMIGRSGANRKDLTCPLMAIVGERIYSVGNEREVSRLDKKGNFGVRDVLARYSIRRSNKTLSSCTSELETPYMLFPS